MKFNTKFVIAFLVGLILALTLDLISLRHQPSIADGAVTSAKISEEISAKMRYCHD